GSSLGRSAPGYQLAVALWRLSDESPIAGAASMGASLRESYGTIKIPRRPRFQAPELDIQRRGRTCCEPGVATRIALWLVTPRAHGNAAGTASVPFDSSPLSGSSLYSKRSPHGACRAARRHCGAPRAETGGHSRESQRATPGPVRADANCVIALRGSEPSV